jgi:PAS domain S-box-containing protein
MIGSVFTAVTLLVFAADPDAITPGSALGMGAGATVVGGIVVGGAMYLTSLLTGGKRMIDRIDELNTRVFKITDDLAECKTAHSDAKLDVANARIENVQLKGELERMQLRIGTLEANSGQVPVPAGFIPGVIITDKSGTIVEFSPSLTSWLGWNPEEMRGQNIEKVVPPEHLDAHRAGFFKAVTPGVTLDPTRIINTAVLDKTGKRVPVSISIRKWPGPDGNMTATLKPRLLAQAGTLPPGTPARRSGDV